MNVWNGLGVMAVAYAVLWGCSSHHDTPSAAAVAPASAAPPVSVAAAPKPLPEWADKFTKASAMIGKPKKDFYTAFGVPTEVNTLTGAYSYRGEFWGLTVTFGKDKVVNCTLAFDPDRPTPGATPNYRDKISIGADVVWEAIGPPGSKPDNCYVERAFTQDSGMQQLSWDVSPSGMSGTLAGGQVVYLSLGRPIGADAPSAALLTCQQKFNPDTNRYDGATCTSKPGFNWKPRQVTSITTDPGTLSYDNYTTSKYAKYPVP